MTSNIQNENLEESGEQDANIKVYDNDEAYMFNDENSNDNSNQGDEGAQDSHSAKISNHEAEAGNEDEEHEHSDGVEHSEQDDHDQFYTNNYANQNNMEEEEESNAQEDTVRNKEENNAEGDIDDQQDNEEQGEVEEEEQQLDDGGVPLITLKFISICQCCKQPFNSTVNIPYLFKCGHFFCKKCIEEQFTDEEGIKCPNDGLVAYSVSELKLLNNLISDKNIDSITTRGNFCDIHKGQKLTHYIEETKELICVYCAFARFKKNPKTEIKEIKEKCKEINSDVSNVILDNQHNVEMIQSALQDIKKNKETEEKRVNLFYDQIFTIIQSSKEETLNKIDSLFRENARKLSMKLDIFTKKMSQSENLKNLIEEVDRNDNSTFMEVLDKYQKLISETADRNAMSVQLQEYRFSHDEETKLVKYITNFGDLKLFTKNYTFNGAKDDMEFGFRTFKTNSSFGVNTVGGISDALNNSEINNTFDFRQAQNGRENKKMFPSSSQTKSMMNKYTYNKPMTPGEYRTNDMMKNYSYKIGKK